jgi:hypothetical protein
MILGNLRWQKCMWIIIEVGDRWLSKYISTNERFNLQILGNFQNIKSFRMNQKLILFSKNLHE